MAPYTQQPQHMDYQPRPGFGGRGGYNNGGRGNGKKNRGGKFNGNDHFNSGGRGRAPHGNQNYAPPGVSGMPPDGGYPPGSPTAWQMPRRNYPMSVGGMSSGMAPFPPMAAPPSNHAVSMGFVARSPTVGEHIPQRNPSYGIHSAHAPPVDYSSLQVATPNIYATAPALKPYTKELPMADSTCDNSAAKPDVNTSNATSASNAADAGINMRGAAPTFVPTIYAPIPRRTGTALTESNMIAESTPATPVPGDDAGQCASATPVVIPVAEPCAPTDNAVVSLQETNKKADELSDLLIRGALALIQTLSITDAEELMSTLKEASKERHVKQVAIEEKRKQAIANLTQAYRQEEACEKHITFLLEHVTRKMTESLDSEDKEALQRKAIVSLQIATRQSNLAAKYRLRVEAGWKEVYAVEYKNVEAMNIHLNTLRLAVEDYAARAQKVAEPQEDEKESCDLVDLLDTTLHAPGRTNEDQTKLETRLPQCAEELTQQSVYERHPEKLNKTMGEVFQNAKVTEEQVGLKEPEGKVTADELTSMIHEKLHVGADKKTELTPVEGDAMETVKREVKKDDLTGNTTTKHPDKDSRTSDAAPKDQTSDKAADQGSKRRSWKKNKKSKRKNVALDSKVEGERPKTPHGANNGQDNQKSG